MRRVVVVAVLVGLGVLAAGGVNATGVWGTATPAVFAAGVQNSVQNAYFNSVACESEGNCTAAGRFLNAAVGSEAFVMSSTNGVWGQATPAVFAAGVQSTTPNAEFKSVSCASAGNCTAVGYFLNVTSGSEAFVMSSTNGVWGQATPAVFAAGVQNTNPIAEFKSVACASAGNCTAVGGFYNVAGGFEAFVMSSTAGVWGQATRAVFAAGVQYTIPTGYLSSVSCVSAGNCTAVGQFANVAGDLEAFVMSSTNGVWGQATPAVFAAGVQGTNPEAYLQSVACVSAGNCTAVGRFKNVAGDYEAFVMSSTGGVWGQATPAEFAAGVQSTTPNAYLQSVSCVSVGNCTAVGSFVNVAGGYEAFVMSSTAGVWGQANPAVFAAGVQNATPNAGFNSVSCVSVGKCTAVGSFVNVAGGYEAFVMSSTAGVWGQANPAVFAAGVQNTSPHAAFTSVVCASAGNCTAVGYFLNVTSGTEAFVMSSIDETPVTTTVPVSTTAPAPVLPATGSGTSASWLVIALASLVVGSVLVSRRRII